MYICTHVQLVVYVLTKKKTCPRVTIMYNIIICTISTSNAVRVQCSLYMYVQAFAGQKVHVHVCTCIYMYIFCL